MIYIHLIWQYLCDLKNRQYKYRIQITLQQFMDVQWYSGEEGPSVAPFINNGLKMWGDAALWAKQHDMQMQPWFARVTREGKVELDACVLLMFRHQEDMVEFKLRFLNI